MNNIFQKSETQSFAPIGFHFNENEKEITKNNWENVLIICFKNSKNVRAYMAQGKQQQEVQGPWRSASQLQLGCHWQFSVDLYQKLTAAD